MTINYADQIKKDGENGFNVHAKYKHLDVEGLRTVCESESLPFSVCAINFTGDLNTGVVMRAASIMGADEFILFGRSKFDRRSTVGAQNYIPTFTKIDGLKEDLSIDIDKFVSYMEERKFVPIFVETNGTPLQHIDWHKKPLIMYHSDITAERMDMKYCFVFGNESFGIPDELMNRYEHMKNCMKISIPQRGVLRSLNVSSAASMILWDYVRHLTLFNEFCDNLDRSLEWNKELEK